jgi:alditol oxidase
MRSIEPSSVSSQRELNWAGNYAYQGQVVRPDSVEALQELMASSRRVRFLGTRHSFNAIGDSDLVIDMRELPEFVDVDLQRGCVMVSGNSTYGTLARRLEEQGAALENLASLPHISVAGSISTGTHGSGVGHGGLATAVTALDIVRADGELVTVARGDQDFAGCVVSLGALGAIVRVTLEIVPTYEVRQSVTTHVPFPLVIEDLRAVMSAGYSVSLFTMWDGEVSQAWVKQREDQITIPNTALSAGKPATRQLHPLGDLDPVNCTPQLGLPGPWYDRLPHFRLGYTPSAGEELQSEFLVDWADAESALRAVQSLEPATWSSLLISEIRAVASDDLWLSPAFGRESLAIHFTWRKDIPAVSTALRSVEVALAPLMARPHWGKVFNGSFHRAAELYPRLQDFTALRERFDPCDGFRNDWLDLNVLGERQAR